MKKNRSLWLKFLIGSAILFGVLLAAFFIYVGIYFKAGSLAKKSLKSDSIVKVEKDGNILFEPQTNAKNTGFIFYPGAKVESSAYAPLAKEIASKGYRVIIAKMLFHLAIFSPNKAESIINKYNDINTWVIGGHSLGGVMAADYAYRSSRIKGLIFLASYPQSKNNFSDKKIRVLSLWGSNDGIADLNKIKNAKRVLPKDAEFIEIKGGNHAGFGDYGKQKGDNKATITNKQQMLETSDYIVKFLDSFK